MAIFQDSFEVAARAGTPPLYSAPRKVLFRVFGMIMSALPCTHPVVPARIAPFWFDYTAVSDSDNGSQPVFRDDTSETFATFIHAARAVKLAKPGAIVCVMSRPHQTIGGGQALGKPITYDGSGCGDKAAVGLPLRTKIVGDDNTSNDEIGSLSARPVEGPHS